MDNMRYLEPLDAVADMLSGGTPSKSNPRYWNGSIPWLTPKDMGRWSGMTEASVSTEAIGNGTRLAPENTVFIAVRGMSLHNEIRVIRSPKALSFNQDIKAIVPKSGIDPLYLYYVLLSKKPELLASVEAAGHGTGRLPTDKLKALDVPRFGSRTEVSLAELFESIDSKIDLNHRMNESLEAMVQSIFNDWFVDFGPTRAKMEGREPYLEPALWSLFPENLDEDGNPKGWKERPLDQIADFLNGLALQNYPPKGNRAIPVIKIAQLRVGHTEKSDAASADIPAPYVIEDGDILFSWSGSLMHCIWTGGRGALNQHLFKVTSSTFPKWFVFHWIGHHMPDFQATAASKATTMGHIQRYHLTQALTIVPTPQVMSVADELMSPLFSRIITNNLESRTLAQTRDLLLPRLLSGEIRLCDADKVVEEVA